MRILYVLLCVICGELLCATAQNVAHNSAQAAPPSLRKGRESFSSVFRPLPFPQVVRFANLECETDEGYNGTCYRSDECQQLDGTDAGECSDGYGVCCMVTATCHQTVSHNVTYFVPKEYPSPKTDQGACPLHVEKASSDICQLRLDFHEFDIMGPTSGDCKDDMFVVTGANQNHFVPILCGFNTGHHIYINVDTIQSAVTLNMITGIVPGKRRWMIKISQIPCNSPSKAPYGCLQYYTGLNGHVESFNFNHRDDRRSGYLNNLDYTTCFRRDRDMCSITYRVRTERDEYVPLGGNDTLALDVASNAEGRATAQTSHAFYGIDSADHAFLGGAKSGYKQCPDDYMAILGYDRFCGGVFSKRVNATTHEDITVKSNTPAMIHFKSDKSNNGRGFSISYQQGPCTPTYH